MEDLASVRVDFGFPIIRSFMVPGQRADVHQ